MPTLRHLIPRLLVRPVTAYTHTLPLLEMCNIRGHNKGVVINKGPVSENYWLQGEN